MHYDSIGWNSVASLCQFREKIKNLHKTENFSSKTKEIVLSGHKHLYVILCNQFLEDVLETVASFCTLI